jgi:hypothetical protein
VLDSVALNIGAIVLTPVVPGGYLDVLYACPRQTRSPVNQGGELWAVHNVMVGKSRTVSTSKLRQAPLDRILECMYARAM